MRGPEWARGMQNDHRWDCDRSNPPAHMSPSSVLVAERGDWRLMRSTLARGYFAVHDSKNKHERYLLRATDDVSAKAEFIRHVDGRA